jgi:hypothetical protein
MSVDDVSQSRAELLIWSRTHSDKLDLLSNQRVGQESLVQVQVIYRR